MRSGWTATSPTGPTQTALRTRPPVHWNMIFDLPIDSLLTRYASVTAPASKGQVPCRRLRSQTFGLSIDILCTAPRIECHLCLRKPVVQPSFVRLANRLAPSQAPLHALRQIQIGALPSCARSGSPLVPRSPPGSVTPRQPHLIAPDNRRSNRYAPPRHGTC